MSRTVHAGPQRDESGIRVALKRLKHRLVIRFTKRANRVYTQFNRFPHQYIALRDRVIPVLRPESGSGSPPLEIVMFGCCSGAEAFSLSWFLRQNFPALPFRIRGFDIVPEVIEKAQAGVFSREEVYQGPFVTDAFVASVFDAEDGNYRVKPDIATPVTCEVGSILDPDLMQRLGAADMVVAQNLLFHLPPPQARTAFGYLVKLMAPVSALCINGMDTDMRVDLTKHYGLQPLDYLVEKIHEDSRVDRGAAWASAYWGREPFSKMSRDWLRQFGTIFLRAAVSSCPSST